MRWTDPALFRHTLILLLGLYFLFRTYRYSSKRLNSPWKKETQFRSTVKLQEATISNSRVRRSSKKLLYPSLTLCPIYRGVEQAEVTIWHSSMCLVVNNELLNLMTKFTLDSHPGKIQSNPFRFCQTFPTNATNFLRELQFHLPLPTSIRSVGKINGLVEMPVCSINLPVLTV